MSPKICFFIPSFHPLTGGAENQAKILAHQLIKDGLNVFILTRRIKGTSSFEVLNIVPIYRVFAKFHSIFFIISSLLWLIVHKKKYDIINVHTFDSPAVVSCLIKFFLPSKKIFIKVRRTGLGTPLAKYKKSFSGNIKLKILRNQASGFIALTQEAKKELLEVGISEKKIKLIPNGVDSNKYKPVSNEQKSQLKEKYGLNNKIIGITVCRLIPRKGVDILIKLWAEISNTASKYTLIIIGDGKERKKLELLIKRKNVTKQIILKGNCPEDEVLTYLQLSDFFLLPSKSEGISNAMLEAMSCALPVIAFRIGGTEDLIENGANGLLCEVGNLECYMRNLLVLLTDKEMRSNLGFQARKKIVNEYSLETIAKKYRRCLSMNSNESH